MLCRWRRNIPVSCLSSLRLSTLATMLSYLSTIFVRSHLRFIATTNETSRISSWKFIRQIFAWNIFFSFFISALSGMIFLILSALLFTSYAQNEIDFDNPGVSFQPDSILFPNCFLESSCESQSRLHFFENIPLHSNLSPRWSINVSSSTLSFR